MSGSAPSATTLHNYDNDRDAGEGIVIARGGLGADESTPTEFQAWRSAAFSSGAVLPDTVTVTLWTAMKDFDPAKQGSVWIYLRDFSGTSHETIVAALVTEPNWLNGSGIWQELSVTMTVGGGTLAAGHQLELKVVVSGQLSEDDLWFAYDTVAHPARIDVP